MWATGEKSETWLVQGWRPRRGGWVVGDMRARRATRTGWRERGKGGLECSWVTATRALGRRRPRSERWSQMQEASRGRGGRGGRVKGTREEQDPGRPSYMSKQTPLIRHVHRLLSSTSNALFIQQL